MKHNLIPASLEHEMATKRPLLRSKRTLWETSPASAVHASRGSLTIERSLVHEDNWRAKPKDRNGQCACFTNEERRNPKRFFVSLSPRGVFVCFFSNSLWTEKRYFLLWPILQLSRAPNLGPLQICMCRLRQLCLRTLQPCFAQSERTLFM